MYQQCEIIGHVGSENVDMRYTPSGVPVANFGVAVNKRWTGQDGQQQEKTTWFRVACWRRLAEVVNEYVHKGMQVFVSGEIDCSAWTAKDGEARASLELRAYTVKFLGTRGDSGDQMQRVVEQAEEVPF